MLKKLLCLTGTFVVLLAFLCGPAAFAQNKTVRGKIVDVQGAPVVGAAIVLWEDDGYKARGGGFVPGKHELYPFPFDVVTANPWNPETGTGIKQNPGWD
ncbi:MAG: hypothetical protein IK098_01895 [Bacteroidales bacterium]|nr:hypothetical protein [Bacteroidales bacterium]